jgi:hypothetical protein
MPANQLFQSSDHESEPAVRSSLWRDLESLRADLEFLSADLAFPRAELNFEASDHAIEAGDDDDQAGHRVALGDDHVCVSSDSASQAPVLEIELANHASLSGELERVSANLSSLCANAGSVGAILDSV